MTKGIGVGGISRIHIVEVGMTIGMDIGTDINVDIVWLHDMTVWCEIDKILSMWFRYTS